MDRIPKFRRKPKNPTIETAVERSSTDTVDSIASAEIQAANTQQKQLQPQKSATKLSKKSAFRNFRLRASAKRARESSPSELPSSPPPAIVSQDGIKSRPVTADGNVIKNGKGATLQIPAFFDSYMQGTRSLPCATWIHANHHPDIDFKFQELTWAERDRLLEGTKHESEGFKWGTFKQLDVPEKGQMDRYFNIQPWNHNRVRLQVPVNELDYVNASEITLESPSDPDKLPLRYIAMQGPTPPSFGYVWRMIAEQLSSPAVIVQLTTMSEGGNVKCDQYFPDSEEDPTWVINEQNAWGDGWKAQLTLDSLDELCDGSIEKRKLLLHVEGEEEARVVWHFLYRRWPDFGVPELEDLDGFFELMRLSLEHSAPSNPRIIHCSAGVGRTGTFITLDHLVRELESGAFEGYDTPTQGTDLIYETVSILREQRMSMVQSKPQYHFLYQVMCKLWHDKYGIDEEGGEPAAKRLEVGDPFLDAGPGPDAYEVGIAR